MWRPLLLVVAALAASGLESGPLAPSGAQCLDSACFALFWAARNASQAAALCRGGGGQLMSVRSTVAAEAIAVLLQGRAGSAWLGLRLPEPRCAEPAKQLRGFRWEAGDERTDYSAWADGGGAAGCGPRCVVVLSGEQQQQRWKERACNASADGILCEYLYPGGAVCAPLKAPPPHEATYVTPFGARESDLVALPPGSTAALPGLGVRLQCRAQGNGSAAQWSSASPGAWHCQVLNGGCDGLCSFDDAQGLPFCTCPEDARLGEDQRSCLSACANLQCQHFCHRGVCLCQEGYELARDGRSCKDVDECQAQPQPCLPSQVCYNAEGSFECRCPAGFTLVDGICIDQWVCYAMECQHECSLVNGTYKCTCFRGYIPDPTNPQKCVQFCNQSTCAAQCDPHAQESCFCPPGYIIDEEGGTKVCADRDECSDDNPCDKECINLYGSYMCICSDGSAVPSQHLCEDGLKEPEDLFSGETESYPETLAPTPVPPKDGSSPAVLAAIVVSTVFSVTMLVAILYCLVKKRRSAHAALDYKCQHSGTEVALRQVRSGNSTSRLKV